ncbi:MAG: pyrimidine dimer DNA glycosylase/endonuclease V [Acutalibacteraceae bacterium]|nr:pyrimidine dimer DNA glycosylase/endonuclease V [Acutalibacteraceae bacterium]
MRLWSYQLIPVLPNTMLISQWRECIAIKRQWGEGTLKHRLVSYVLNHDEIYFGQYVKDIVKELTKRGIKYNDDLYYELCLFSNVSYVNIGNSNINYPEHNDRYLKQCLYNLQEKADRGIISQEEWQKIEDKFGGVM